MITTRGKTFLKRYIAGQSGSAPSALAVGIGNAAAALTDGKMQFEFARAPIDLAAYDVATDRLVYKATLPEEIGGVISEVGLWTAEEDSAAGDKASRLVSTFDSASENWSGGTFGNTTTRIGADSLVQSPATSSTTIALLNDFGMDFSQYGSADLFTFAFNVESANVTAISCRFETDASNFYSFNFGAQTAGYKFQSFAKGDATLSGTPDWSDIQRIQLRVVAGSGGSATVQWDGIRLDPINASSPDYGLISRNVLATPIIKEEGVALDIEYTLNITA